MIVLVLFLFLSTALSAYSGGKSMGQNPHVTKRSLDSIKALIDSEWEKVQPSTNLGKGVDEGPPEPFWFYLVSPAFPSVWPPDRSLAMIYYVYAIGQAPRSLADGIYVAAPWGRVEVDIKGRFSPKFKLLSNEIKEIGIQGVRPLEEEEVAIFKKGDAAEAFWGSLTSLPDEKEKSVSDLRKYYCTWLELNGAIAQEIRPLHKEFFKWLGCK